MFQFRPQSILPSDNSRKLKNAPEGRARCISHLLAVSCISKRIRSSVSIASRIKTWNRLHKPFNRTAIPVANCNMTQGRWAFDLRPRRRRLHFLDCFVAEECLRLHHSAIFESCSQASSRAANLEFFNQQKPERRVEIAGAEGVVQLAQDFRFDLADALTGGCVRLRVVRRPRIIGEPVYAEKQHAREENDPMGASVSIGSRPVREDMRRTVDTWGFKRPFASFVVWQVSAGGTWCPPPYKLPFLRLRMPRKSARRCGSQSRLWLRDSS
jgi:hypothetical protein